MLSFGLLDCWSSKNGRLKELTVQMQNKEVILVNVLVRNAGDALDNLLRKLIVNDREPTPSFSAVCLWCCSIIND